MVVQRGRPLDVLSFCAYVLNPPLLPVGFGPRSHGPGQPGEARFQQLLTQTVPTAPPSAPSLPRGRRGHLSGEAFCRRACPAPRSQEGSTEPTGFAPRFGKEAVPLRPHSSGSGRFFSATRPTPRKPRFREEALVLRRCPGGLENKKRPSRTLPPGAIPSGSFVQGRLFCVGTGSNTHSGASALRTTHRFPASGHHCPSRFRCDVRPPAKRADAGTMAGLPQPVKPSRPSGIRPSRQLITAATPRGRAPRS